jgi:hypothetical protein
MVGVGNEVPSTCLEGRGGWATRLLALVWRAEGDAAHSRSSVTRVRIAWRVWMWNDPPVW